MIRLKPYEWLHMIIPGKGASGKNRLVGSLYMMPYRVVIQNKSGPVWMAEISDIEVLSKDTIRVQDGRQLKWTTKSHLWWTEAIKFWKEGVVQDNTDPLPTYTTIHELPETMQRSRYNIRWYNKDTLHVEKETDEFKKAAKDTNIILAALRHDGFPNGPPPREYVRALQRHALVHVTGLVWFWLASKRRLFNIITGRGHQNGEGYLNKHFGNDHNAWIAEHPDSYYMAKPFALKRPEWHHEIHPGTLGGHPYMMLEQCNKMIPIIRRLADIIHEKPTHAPYLRIRQGYEALKTDRPIPPTPLAALPAAKAATNELW